MADRAEIRRIREQAADGRGEKACNSKEKYEKALDIGRKLYYYK